MVKLYQFQSSPFCEKVRRILNYKGVDFETVEVDRRQVALHVNVSPFGKFPAISNGDDAVCDSTDIAYYLEEKFPEKSLIPTDEKLNAQMHMAEDWADESLYFYEITMRLSWEHNARQTVKKVMATLPPELSEEQALSLMLNGSQKLIAAQGMGRKTKEQVIADAERHLKAISVTVGESGYMVGDSITLADISVISQLGCMLDATEVRQMIESYPNVSNWMNRVNDLAAP